MRAEHKSSQSQSNDPQFQDWVLERVRGTFFIKAIAGAVAVAAATASIATAAAAAVAKKMKACMGLLSGSHHHCFRFPAGGGDQDVWFYFPDLFTILLLSDAKHCTGLLSKPSSPILGSLWFYFLILSVRFLLRLRVYFLDLQLLLILPHNSLLSESPFSFRSTTYGSTF